MQYFQHETISSLAIAWYQLVGTPLSPMLGAVRLTQQALKKLTTCQFKV
jgi:hypothetical protein